MRLTCLRYVVCLTLLTVTAHAQPIPHWREIGPRVLTTDGPSEVEIKTYGTQNPLHIINVLGPLADPDSAALAIVQVDESESTGGSVSMLQLLRTQAGDATVFGLDVGHGVTAIRQRRGNHEAVEDDDSLKLNDTTSVGDDLTPGVGAGGVTAFASNGDTLYIRNSYLGGKYDAVQIIVSTPASEPGVEWKWEYRKADGSWTEFVPVDGTHGLRNSGVVTWDVNAMPGWGTDPDMFRTVRATRQRAALTTAPVLDTVLLGYIYSGVPDFRWDEEGNVNLNSLSLLTPLSQQNGGTGTTSASFTYHGIVYVGAGSALSSTTANATTVRKFLRQVGDNVNSGAPDWDTVTSTDISDSTTTGRALLTATDDAAGRTALSLGSIATQAANSVAITGGTVGGLTAFGVRSTGTGAFDLKLANAENLTADRTLTVVLNDAARTLTVAGNATINDWFDQSVKTTADPTFNAATFTDRRTTRQRLGILRGYLASDQTVTSSVALTVPTLTNAVTLVNGRRYRIYGYFPFSCGTGGGIRARLGGGGVSGTMECHVEIMNNTFVTQNINSGRFTTMAGSTTSGTGTLTDGFIEIRGWIDATASANLSIAFAQDTSNGTGTVLRAGGYLEAEEF